MPLGRSGRPWQPGSGRASADRGCTASAAILRCVPRFPVQLRRARRTKAPADAKPVPGDAPIRQAKRSRTGYALGRLRVLPDYLIIGAARAGTTSLHAQIEQHPDVLPSRRQEVHFFDSPRYLNGANYYRLYFPSRARMRWQELRRGRRPLTGESSPYALFHPHAAERVRALLPDARFIVLLRDPVERAHSDWAMRRRRGAEPLSFEDAIAEEERIAADELGRLAADSTYESARLRQYAYLARGVYADQLARWFAAFPREQLLILQSEAYRRDVPGALDRVWAHLGLPPHRLAEHPTKNRGTYEPMADATRARLRAWFAPHDERLYALLGERYDWDDG
jgi:hypothetical protein